jgi:hemerythrin superfamily protein
MLMDAIKFLLKEHNKVRRIFKDINKSSRRDLTKRKMFKKLCNDLVVHEAMEQKKWYPTLKKNNNLKETIKHLLSEEKKAAKAIKSFKKIRSQEEWNNKFLEFKNDVEHHASEEEKKLFPKVKKYFDEVELKKLGKEMHQFKKYHS